MPIRLLSATDLEKALPMEAALEAADAAFAALSAGRADTPQRLALHTPGGVSLFMPAFLQDSGALTVKVVSVYPQNPAQGLATIQALVLALDSRTGLPLGILEGRRLTARRTGAAAGLATRLLARPQARVLALLGAGGMAWDQALGVLAARPLSHIRVYDPDEAAAGNLADRLRQGYPDLRVSVTQDAGQAVRGAEIITCVTTSSTPVFDPADVSPGTHINGVGAYTPEMREVQVAGLADLRIFVDSKSAVLTEAGDLIQAIKEGVISENDLVEIGRVINGRAPGRAFDQEITFFKTVGVAAQDAAAALTALNRAEEMGLGVLVEW